MQVLDQEQAVRADERRRQVRSELRFGRHGSPPVEVPLGDGRTVRFAGAADRVDLTDDGALVVVDYKSGKAERFKGLRETDPTKAGTKLQLPVYAHAARAALGRPDAPVRAEYWFIGPKDRGTRVPLELTAEVSERHADALRVAVDGISGGLYPANAPEDQPWTSFVACPYCDPDGLGAKDRRIQWQRKKGAPELRRYLGLVEPGEAPDDGHGDEAGS
jgi:hypothetical protein